MKYQNNDLNQLHSDIITNMRKNINQSNDGINYNQKKFKSHIFN